MVANLHDFDNGSGDGGGGALGVVATRHDTVEELAALAELHDEVNGIVVLVRVLQRHNVRVFGQVPHDLHLPPHVLDIYRGSKLLL